MSKSNHEHILERVASYQHLWRFSAELTHKSDSFLLSINEFNRLMRQIAKYRSDDDAVVEYVLHLMRQTDGTMILKFLASLPLSQNTGEEVFIHEAELEAVVFSLWDGDVLRFSVFHTEPSVSVADCLGYPATGSLTTKMVMSRGIITGQAGAAMDTSCALCGK